MTTIFDKIINHEVPADFVYQDDLVVAFLDINPINRGHVLVVPKKGFENIFDGDEDTFAYMAKVAMQIGNAVKQAVGADGINLIMSNGEAAGQEVPHAHIHVIPRFAGDNAVIKASHGKYEEGEAKEVATQILGAL